MQSSTDFYPLTYATIKDVHYSDMMREAGFYDEKTDTHFLDEGEIFLSLKDGRIARIYNDFGLQIEWAGENARDTVRVSLKRDKIWSRIKDVTIKGVKIEMGHFFLGKERKEMLSSFEFIFGRRERLRISAATLDADGHYEPDSLSLALQVYVGKIEP